MLKLWNKELAWNGLKGLEMAGHGWNLPGYVRFWPVVLYMNWLIDDDEWNLMAFVYLTCSLFCSLVHNQLIKTAACDMTESIKISMRVGETGK